MGKKIFRPFDETVEFAESAKTTWDNALYKSSAERVLAIIGVRDDLDKSKEKMESLKKVLEKNKFMALLFHNYTLLTDDKDMCALKAEE